MIQIHIKYYCIRDHSFTRSHSSLQFSLKNLEHIWIYLTMHCTIISSKCSSALKWSLATVLYLNKTTRFADVNKSDCCIKLISCWKSFMWRVSDWCSWSWWFSCSVEFHYGLWRAKKHSLNQTMILTIEILDQEKPLMIIICQETHGVQQPWMHQSAKMSWWDIKIKLWADHNINWKNTFIFVTVVGFIFISHTHFTLIFWNSSGQHLPRAVFFTHIKGGEAMLGL